MVSRSSSGRAATGVEGFDLILGGGFLPHRVYLVEGDPGAGKTTLGMQFLIQGAHEGERGLYVTLSESIEELRAVSDSHGWSLDGIDLFELVSSEEMLRPDSQYTMFHPAEVELGETTDRILAQIEQIKPHRVVFDSLSEIRLLAQNSLRYRRQVLALKQFFIGRGCTVLLLDDRTSELHDLHLQSIAHGVVSLEQLAPEFGAERRRLRVVKMRGTQYRGGYHDFKIHRGGLQVYPRLVAAEHRGSFAQRQFVSGIAGLDKLVGGGLDSGTSTLLMGPAGSGKSSLAVQYALAAAERGEHAAIFAFDETIATFRHRCEGMGMHITPHLQSGRIRVQQVDPAELSPGEFAAQVCKSVLPSEGMGASVVIIDSLNGYLQAMPEERFLVIQLHELLTLLSQHGVLTLLVVAEHGMVGNVAPPVDTSYLADTVIVTRYFEKYGEVRLAMSVVKKRTGAHDRMIHELHIGKEGIRLGERLGDVQGVLGGTPTILGGGPAD